MVRFSDLAWTDKGQRAGSPSSPGTVFSTFQPPVDKDTPPQKATVVEEVVDEESRKKLYEDAYYYLGKVFEAVKNRKKFAIEPGIRIVREMVETDPARDALFVKAIHHDDQFDFLLTKSVNISIYSIRLGIQLGFDKQKLLELGLSGLFHDVGMWVIPDEILYKKGALSDKEFGLIKQHSDFGYKILKSFEDRFPFLADCALQVHERQDGSGYPQGLRGDEIQEFPQIVGLADTYEALSHSRAHREKYNHFNAIKQIIKTGKNKFQPLHMKALLTAFSIFPLYSYVRLNSNAIGKVIETYPEQPMRPKLQIVCDSQGQKVLTERITSLTENSLLYIVDSVSEEDVFCLASQASVSVEEAGAAESDSHPPTPKRHMRSAEIITDSGRALTGMNWTHPMVMAGAVVALGLIFIGIFMQFQKPRAPDIQESLSPPKTVVRKSIPHEIFKETKIEVPPSAPGIEKQSKLEETLRAKEELESVEETVMAEEVLPVPAVIQPESTGIAEKPAEISRSEAEDQEAVKALTVIESVAPISPEAPQEQIAVETPDRVAPRFEKSYPFSILMASFKRLVDVQSALEIYERQGLRPYWVKVDLGDDGIWYRVFTGWFQNLGQAEGILMNQGIRNAQIKKTPYANYIGTYDNATEREQVAGEIFRKGWNSYAIETPEGAFHLFVGAFYTEAGAQIQKALLEEAGIANQVVVR